MEWHVFFCHFHTHINTPIKNPQIGISFNVLQMKMNRMVLFLSPLPLPSSSFSLLVLLLFLICLYMSTHIPCGVMSPTVFYCSSLFLLFLSYLHGVHAIWLQPKEVQRITDEWRRPSPFPFFLSPSFISLSRSLLPFVSALSTDNTHTNIFYSHSFIFIPLLHPLSPLQLIQIPPLLPPFLFLSSSSSSSSPLLPFSHSPFLL